MDLIITFTYKLTTNYLAKLLRIGLGLRPLLSKVLICAILLSVGLILIGLNANNRSVTSAFNESGMFGDNITGILPSGVNNLGIEGVVILFVFIILVGVLVSLCLGAGSNVLLHTANSGRRCIIVLTEGPNTSGVLNLTVKGKLTTLDNTIITRDARSTGARVNINVIIFKLSDIVVKLSLFGHINFVGTAAVIVLNAIVCGTYLRVTIIVNLPDSCGGLLVTILFIITLLFNGAKGVGLGEERGGT